MNHTFVDHLDHPIELAVLDDDVFWTSKYGRSVYWSPKHRSGEKHRLDIAMPPYARQPDDDAIMRLLALLPPQASSTQSTAHVCRQPAHSGCSHVCIPLSRTQYTCLCPPGWTFKDSHTNRTCVSEEDCGFR